MPRIAFILALLASLAHAALGNVPASASLCLGSMHPDGHGCGDAALVADADPVIEAVLPACASGCDHDDAQASTVRIVSDDDAAGHDDCCCVDVELNGEDSAPSAREDRSLDAGPAPAFDAPVIVLPAFSGLAALTMHRGPPVDVGPASGDAAAWRSLAVLRATRLRL